MATYTDDFERANGTLGADWTAVDGTMQIFSGTACGNGSGDSVYSAGTFLNDHYSEITTSNAGNNVYALVRITGSDYYYGYTRPGFGDYSIRKWVGGVENVLASGSISSAVGDTIRLEASGTTITLKLNGVVVDSGTDGALTSGKPGMGSSDPGSRIDLWTGGDLGSAPVVGSSFIINNMRPNIFAPGKVR